MKLLLVVSVLLAACVVYGDRGGSCPDALAPTCACTDGTAVPTRSKGKSCPEGRPTCLCTDGSAPIKEESGEHIEDGSRENQRGKKNRSRRDVDSESVESGESGQSGSSESQEGKRRRRR